MQTDELAEHLFGSVLGALDVLTVAVGAHFGLYDLLHREPRTAAEAAAASGMAPRYAREWLEQQCVAGLVDVDDPALPPEQRTYAVSDAHAAVLCDPDSLAFTTPLAQIVAAAGVQLPRLLEAYAGGGGLRWHEYGELMSPRTGRRQPAPVPGAPRHRVAARADPGARRPRRGRAGR
ncbi:hypothetical protein I601_1361 [Nocardioides dokdonensis FR1436]|uniref:S-adenosylmethionine-dependent methyltransferase Rv2258c-like winged HTH domain-containing protein n=1 Tax=Nocardioides dokdonensis FR1436 TaxID=1300347 RepID=A0A1A9GJE5_9ACTN|nr:hypothetical protein [Nocardioides dokdonensis]ANH37800.1 hypothetical protein I601_1361 [Nocardioides dokdonensis FR1436]